MTHNSSSPTRPAPATAPPGPFKVNQYNNYGDPQRASPAANLGVVEQLAGQAPRARAQSTGATGATSELATRATREARRSAAAAVSTSMLQVVGDGGGGGAAAEPASDAPGEPCGGGGSGSRLVHHEGSRMVQTMQMNRPAGGGSTGQLGPPMQQQHQQQHQHQLVPREPRDDQREPELARGAASKSHRQQVIEREQQTLRLLRKNSFVCMLVGARQVGKRTIVKCFVKLLNEFKLAADEYKKEKMLSKLMECSERLNELASQQLEEKEQQQQQEDAGAGGGNLLERRFSRCRLNSWLPGGAGRRLLQWSPKSQAAQKAGRRLHSVAGLWSVGASKEQQRGQEGQRSEQSGKGEQRRHTTFEPARDGQGMQQGQFLEVQTTTTTTLGGHLAAGAGGGGGGLVSCYNKSDSNVNYVSTVDSGQHGSLQGKQEQQQPPPPQREAGQGSVTVHQLKVPALEPSQLRKHSDPTQARSSTLRSQQQGEAPRTNGRQSGGEAPAGKSTVTIRRHTEFGIGHQQHGGSQSGYQQHQGPKEDQAAPSGPRRGTIRVGADKSRSRRRESTRSACVGLSRRRRRLLLSLKELNRRRCGIKFKTRRQINETYLEQLRGPVIEQIKRRASQLPAGPMVAAAAARLEAPDQQQQQQELDLPDAFIVVYSINDRESFEYARTLIGQLRAHKQDVPMPIIVVANKIDLERVRVVKREEGRNLARKNECKFMEISCTVGFNLDNLLVGLRTQLILRHHIVLNSIIRGKPMRTIAAKQRGIAEEGDGRGPKSSTGQANEKAKSSENILIRFYKRYVMDSSEQAYNCDNFSRL